MLLYVSGSYPENQEGIAAGAKVLLDAFIDAANKEDFLLLTTNTDIITENIEKNSNCRYELFDNWKVTGKNIRHLYSILDENPITAIHMEYPGDLYGKTFFASFLPYFVKRYNKKRKKEVSTNVRLHEFTKARFLRKLAIIPILLFADRVYVPAQKDREVVSKFVRGKLDSTYIGTNIRVVSDVLCSSEKTVISYFGSVYPGKGIEHMLSVWKAIREKDTENKFVFKIIGDVGTEETNHFCSYHKQVWEWIRQYDLESCIEVTGYVSDEEVSKEIQNTQIATLFYEDGLTLRRGSFLAYLAHGIPVVTSMGDEESIALFKNHDGVCMTKNDNEIVDKILEISKLDIEKRERIREDNINLSKNFDWKNIANVFLRDYGLKHE